MKRFLTILMFCMVTVTRVAGEWPMLREYEGEHLDKVKIPLGGIGTGTISISGRGGLVDWEIFNEPAKGFVPATSYRWPPIYNPSFVIRCEMHDGKRCARLLEGPVETSNYEGEFGARSPNQGFPRFEKVVFKAAYPLAQVDPVGSR